MEGMEVQLGRGICLSTVRNTLGKDKKEVLGSPGLKFLHFPRLKVMPSCRHILEVPKTDAAPTFALGCL